MKNIYAMALEGRTEVEREAIEPTQRTVVIAGPLSEQFTQELARQYAKTDPVTGNAQEPDSAPAEKIAVESQAQEVTIMQNLVSNLSRGVAEPDKGALNPEGGKITIYGVDEAEITPEDVVDVTGELAEQENPRDFVVIIKPEDETSNANTETAPVAEVAEVEPAGAERQAARKATRAALESIVKKFGGSIYTSLESFCKACENNEAGGVPDDTADPIPEGDIGNNGADDLGADLSDPLEGSMDAPASDPQDQLDA